MNPKTLSYINLGGCGLLTLLLGLQWIANSGLQSDLAGKHRALWNMTNERDVSLARAQGLEMDMVSLKASIESLNTEVTTVQTENTARTEQVEKLTLDLEAARNGLAVWQAGVAERDTRIADLEKNIALYKTRLEEAVARINKVAAERRAQQSKQQ